MSTYVALEGKPARAPYQSESIQIGVDVTMADAAHSGRIRSASSDLSGVKFMTVAEVAAIMRVSKMSVYRLIHSGELEAARFGRSFRVSESTLNAFLNKSYDAAG